jgi:hypothetical protein
MLLRIVDRPRCPAKALSRQRLAIACARLGYEFPRGTLAKVEAGIRSVSDVEVFVLARALKVDFAELYTASLLKTIRHGQVAPFHVRKTVGDD